MTNGDFENQRLLTLFCCQRYWLCIEYSSASASLSFLHLNAVQQLCIFCCFVFFFVSPSRLIDWFIHWLNNNCFSKWTIKRFNPAVWYVIITASSFSYTVYVWHADKLYIMMTVYAYSVGVSLQHWRRQTRLQYICCHRHHHSCVALIYSMHYEETYIKS